MKREYEQQEQLLFIFTKLHTDLCSLVINKINFEKYDSRNILRYIIKLQMMGLFIGDMEHNYIRENRDIVDIVSENVKHELKLERELRLERECRIKCECKEKQYKYIKIGICIGIMALFI